MTKELAGKFHVSQSENKTARKLDIKTFYKPQEVTRLSPTQTLQMLHEKRKEYHAKLEQLDNEIPHWSSDWDKSGATIRKHR